MPSDLTTLLPPGSGPLNRVIVCGSRDWQLAQPIHAAFNTLYGTVNGGRRFEVIHGGARGADYLAGQVATWLGLTIRVELADWVGKGRGAGMERNRRMLDLAPDLVLAFKDGFDMTMRRGGTENMCRISLEAGVPVLLYSTGQGWQYLALDKDKATERRIEWISPSPGTTE